MLTFKNISKSFGKKTILQDLNFELQKGETFVIVGPSGTGKSVTLKHMLGLLSPDDGEIICDGQNIIDYNNRERSDYLRRCGVLFQSGALLAWKTVEQNVALPLIEQGKLKMPEIEKKVAAALKMVNLDDAEEKYPAEISGGMQKRAGLARAIVSEPELILYDEPTSGLDPVMSRKIDTLISDMQKKLPVTQVVVTHDLHSAFAIADRIAMLHEGKFGIIAPPEEFVKSELPYVKEFIKAQFSSGKLGEISCP